MATKPRDVVEQIVRLRRAERATDPSVRAEIAPVLDFLERIAGRTVRPAEAARILGVSQPALHRWIEKGEISAVTTPEGRREIPLSDVVELLEEVDAGRAKGVNRPLSAVIKERQRRSLEAIDVDRLLPPRRGRGHRTAELQALAYHRLVAERLDERFVEDARRRLRRWRAEGRIDPRWGDEWERILASPPSSIARAIGADSPRARALRQTSPFAGALTEQERRALTRAVAEAART
jgi:excisionase family DNA binding protein